MRSGGNLLTYRELDEQANQLAHHLRAQGAGSEDIVAIVMDRSAEIMVSILGVMKAGAAFLPIDPDTPEERIRYSLEDSGARIAVVNERNMTAIGQYEGTIVNLDDAKWRNESKERPLRSPDLVILHTSFIRPVRPGSQKVCKSSIAI